MVKNSEDTITRFDTLHERDGQIDTQSETNDDIGRT